MKTFRPADFYTDLFTRFPPVFAALILFGMPLAYAYASVSVSIQSLSPSTNISVGTNVSFTVASSGFSAPTYSVSDSASGSSVSSSDINTNGNFSWTPTSNDVGTHNLTITVSDSQGDNATTEETLVVSQAPSVSIQALSPSTNITSGQTLTFNVSATGFTNPTYSLSDSFAGSSVSSGDINSSGNFSWTPNSNDVGTHTITVNVNDSLEHSISTSETITVGAESSPGTSGTGGATIQGLNPGTTALIGQPVTFTVAASNFNHPVFSLSDNFTNSTVSSSDINTAGYFSWTPTSNDVGTHNIMIYVNDSSGHTGNVSLTLTVNTPSIVVTSLNPGTTVLPNSTLTFTVSPQGFTNPSYTVSDSFSGTTVTDSDINSSGQFTWTPATSQNGTHTITLYATDSAGHSANTSITVNVNSGTSVALTAPSPSTSVAAGSAVSFQTYAYGFTNPAYTIQDSLSGTTLTNAAMNSSGDFYWIPQAADVGVHSITVSATDAYGHTGSAEATITVTPASGETTTPSAGSLASLESQLAQDESEISASNGFTFQSELSIGMTSSDVTQLQTLLTKEGFFSGSATGYYGALTEAAVKQFQTAHGIDPVGYVGPSTREALNALLSSLASTTTTASSTTQIGDGYTFENFIAYGQTGTDVTELQERLAAFGVYTGQATGYFGSETRTAVEKFQTQHDISAVGYVGPGTRAALNQ